MDTSGRQDPIAGQKGIPSHSVCVLTHFGETAEADALGVPWSDQQPRKVHYNHKYNQHAEARMVLDNGCRRNVGGPKWHKRMRAILRHRCLKPIRKEINENFYSATIRRRSPCAHGCIRLEFIVTMVPWTWQRFNVTVLV